MQSLMKRPLLPMRGPRLARVEVRGARFNEPNCSKVRWDMQGTCTAHARSEKQKFKKNYFSKNKI